MEQELAEVGRVREEEKQQWAQRMAQTQDELGSLKASLEASERQREEAVVRLESEAQQWAAETEELRATLAAAGLEREKNDTFKAELVALRASLEVALGEREEVMKTMEEHAEARDAELAVLRERLAAAEREKEEGMRREGEEVQRLEEELAALRKSLESGQETQDAGVQLKETLGELWRRLYSLTTGPVKGLVEDEERAAVPSFPSDPAECLAALQALEAMMQRLRAEREEREAQLDQVTVSMVSLRGTVIN